MSANVFISFASKDQKVAATLCSALEKRGFSCWISSRDIAPGDNFQSAIVSAIIASKVLLLVFTANSNASDEMTKELAIASQQKLIVVPLRVEDVAPNAAFAYEFATRQWIDLFVDWEKAIDQLCERLTRAMPPAVVAPAAGASTPGAPIAASQATAARKPPIGLFVGLAIAAMLVVASVLFALPMLTTGKASVQQAVAPPTAPLSTSTSAVSAVAPVASASPATSPAPPAQMVVESTATKPAAPHHSSTELADTGSTHRGEDTHSNAYICAHGDDTDYHTIQACDRKDRAEDAGN